MARTEQFSADHIIDAIRGRGPWHEAGSSGGIVTTVAQRLGVQRKTISRYVERYKSVEEAIKDERMGFVDLAEGKLMRKVADGNLTAIIFTLKTLGKDRGYVERVQIEEYIEEALEAMMDALEQGLEPDEFRKVTGLLASADSSTRSSS
jgi:hypothetical protein